MERFVAAESSVGSVSPYFMIREPIYLTLNDVVECSHVIRRERGLATAIVYPRCPCITGTTVVPPLKGTAYLIYARQMRAYCSLFSCAAANAFTSIKHYNNKSILKLDSFRSNTHGWHGVSSLRLFAISSWWTTSIRTTNTTNPFTRASLNYLITILKALAILISSRLYRTCVFYFIFAM